MSTFLQDSRTPRSRSPSRRNKLSRITILGRSFALVWRGHGWELVAVVALLIVALMVWLRFK